MCIVILDSSKSGHDDKRSRSLEDTDGAIKMEIDGRCYLFSLWTRRAFWLCKSSYNASLQIHLKIAYGWFDLTLNWNVANFADLLKLLTIARLLIYRNHKHRNFADKL